MKIWRLSSGDAIFGILTIVSLVYGWFQLNGLMSSTKGVNVSWLTLWQLFMSCGVGLAYTSYRSSRALPVNNPLRGKKVRESSQMLIGYCIGWVCNGTNLAYLVTHRPIFDRLDTTNFAISGIGLVLALIYHHRKPFGPMALATYAFLFKAVPQGFMAWRIGAQGIHPAYFEPVLWFGWGLITLRLGKAFISYRVKKDEGTRGTIISESWNGLSWLAVHLAHKLF